MSRTTIPFSTGDVSRLARTLHTQLAAAGSLPGHVELLNMLARSAGFRNYQHLRASAVAQDRIDAPAAAAPAVDYSLVERLARYFDARGRLVRWPSRANLQSACLWVLWAKLPSKEVLSKAAIDRVIRENHLFGDHPLIRRELCDRGMVRRSADGREYRRVEQSPPGEAVELIRVVGRAR